MSSGAALLHFFIWAIALVMGIISMSAAIYMQMISDVEYRATSVVLYYLFGTSMLLIGNPLIVVGDWEVFGIPMSVVSTAVAFVILFVAELYTLGMIYYYTHIDEDDFSVEVWWKKKTDLERQIDEEFRNGGDDNE